MWRKEKEREQLSKSKSPSKVADAETSGEDKKASKGKCQYIVAITRGVPQENIPSNGHV